MCSLLAILLSDRNQYTLKNEENKTVKELNSYKTTSPFMQNVRRCGSTKKRAQRSSMCQCGSCMSNLYWASEEKKRLSSLLIGLLKMVCGTLGLYSRKYTSD